MGGITEEELRKLEACLRGEEDGVPERMLHERLLRAPDAMTEERAQHVIAEALQANRIRWVAYRGLAWGGRP